MCDGSLQLPPCYARLFYIAATYCDPTCPGPHPVQAQGVYNQPR